MSLTTPIGLDGGSVVTVKFQDCLVSAGRLSGLGLESGDDGVAPQSGGCRTANGSYFMEPKIRVYIAGPYTTGDVSVNVRRAIVMADYLAGYGFIPFVPHLSHLWNLINPRPYDFWISYDLEWLKVCHCLLRLEGKSPGGDKEVEFAKNNDIPVFTEIEDLLSWSYNR